MNYKNTINLIFLAAFLTFGLAANHRPVQADSERELRDAVASLNSGWALMSEPKDGGRSLPSTYLIRNQLSVIQPT